MAIVFTHDMVAATAGVTESIDIKVYDNTGVGVLAGTVLPLALFAIFANGVTIYVVHKSQNLKSVFNYFIMSLATSDIISALVSPLTVYARTWGLDYWNISAFLCKVYWSGNFGTSVLTSLHITVFAALRFVSLKWPHTFTKYTKTVVCLWILSFCSGSLPFLLWMTPSRINRLNIIALRSLPSCGANRDNVQNLMIYSLIGLPTFFFLPCLLVFLFSGGASLLICIRRAQRRKSTRREARAAPNESEMIRQRKENQAIAQLLLICGSYFIGYIPYCAYQIFVMTTPRHTMELQKLGWWLGAVSVISLQFSESLNPIFYNLASSKIRVETVKFLKSVCCKRVATVRRENVAMEPVCKSGTASRTLATVA